MNIDTSYTTNKLTPCTGARSFPLLGHVSVINVGDVIRNKSQMFGDLSLHFIILDVTKSLPEHFFINAMDFQPASETACRLSIMFEYKFI